MQPEALAQILREGARLVVEIWGKGQERERLAPLAEEALVWVERWLSARAAFIETEQIFTSFWYALRLPTGKPLTSAGGYNLVKFYAARVGLPAGIPTICAVLSRRRLRPNSICGRPNMCWGTRCRKRRKRTI